MEMDGSFEGFPRKKKQVPCLGWSYNEMNRWWFQKRNAYFHIYLGKVSILTNIFSNGLVQPPTR